MFLSDIGATIGNRPSVDVMPTPFDFGAFGDGLSHPLSTRFNTLGRAQLVYPHATALTQEIDWAAIQAAINWGPTNGGPIYLPPAWFVINAKVSLKRSSSIFGSGSFGWQGANPGPTTLIDASALTNNTAIQGAGNGLGNRFQDFAILGPASPGASSIGLELGAFASQLVVDRVAVQAFRYGIYGVNTNSVDIIHCQTELQSGNPGVGLYLSAANGVNVLGGMFANATGTQGINISIDGGCTDIDIRQSVVDEAFGTAACSVYVGNATRVLLDLRELFYAHAGYGIRLGNGTNNPTNVTIRDVKIGRFSASTAPTAGIEIRGSGHSLYGVTVDVSADSGATGISDLASDTRMYGCTDITSGGTKYIAVKDPSLPSASPGAGTKQLWYDGADANRVKFAP